MNVHVINSGSSSVKYQAIDTDTSLPLVKGRIERLEGVESYRRAFREVASAVAGHRIDAWGIGWCTAGTISRCPTSSTMRSSAPLPPAPPWPPLHNPANLDGISAAREILSGVPHVAVFDTAFHARMPRRALTYAIDPELAPSLNIRRYGFKGISHALVAQKAADPLGCGLDRLRLVCCHLGNGASACAVEFGTSTETSMGMSPLEGLVMGTRCGDIDEAAAVGLPVGAEDRYCRIAVGENITAEILRRTFRTQ